MYKNERQRKSASLKNATEKGLHFFSIEKEKMWVAFGRKTRVSVKNERVWI